MLAVNSVPEHPIFNDCIELHYDGEDIRFEADVYFLQHKI